MDDSGEEFEPLFDYSRVQPFNVVSLDDDSLDSPPVGCRQKQKIRDTAVEKKDKNSEVIQIDGGDEDEDWLPPPPKITNDATKFSEDPIIKEFRLKSQELASLAQSAKDILRDVEESVKRDLAVAKSGKGVLSASLQSELGGAKGKPAKPSHDRAKIIISIQDKDDTKQFRIYMDDKFEKLFKMYAGKFKLALQNLVFCFDGDKISPTATPGDLGMEDDDIIEVHVKTS